MEKLDELINGLLILGGLWLLGMIVWVISLCRKPKDWFDIF